MEHKKENPGRVASGAGLIGAHPEKRGDIDSNAKWAERIVGSYYIGADSAGYEIRFAKPPDTFASYLVEVIRCQSGALNQRRDETITPLRANSEPTPPPGLRWEIQSISGGFARWRRTHWPETTA